MYNGNAEVPSRIYIFSSKCAYRLSPVAGRGLVLRYQTPHGIIGLVSHIRVRGSVADMSEDVKLKLARLAGHQPVWFPGLPISLVSGATPRSPHYLRANSKSISNYKDTVPRSSKGKV